MECEIDRRNGAVSAVMQAMYRTVVAQPEGEALDQLVDLRSNPHLCSWTLGSDRKDKIVDTNGRNEFPP